MGDFTFEQGQALFLEQVPMRANAPTYRTVRWGKHLQVWMTEGRDYRSPNREPDGPDKTIWGAEQMAWFERTVRASDATFKVLLSPTPVVGPDRKGKNDNHCNVGFAWEGSRLRRFCAEEGMVVACGDRHWQYTSVDPETGLAEYSCGPSTNKHSGGWGARRFIPAYHRYLRVRGGFLHARVDVDRVGPRLVFTHHDVDGRVRYRRVERR